jgi:hypothetical protein
MFQGLALLAAGELSTAQMRLTKGLELAKEIGDPWYIANGLEFLGHGALVRGDLAGARTLFEQSLVHHRAIRNRFGMGIVLTRLAITLQRSGDLVAARASYARALRALHAMGHVETSHQALCGLAELATEAGELARALTLVSVSSALVAVAEVRPSPPVQTRLDQVRATASQALSAEEQAATWAAGQTMPIEQVIAAALADAGPVGREVD